MKYNQQNYKELASRFKVEELKERLEFNMAESSGWSKKTDVEVKAKVDSKGVSGEATVKTQVSW